MATKFWMICASTAGLAVCLAGCNPYPLPGPLHYGKCGVNAHTEAYPRARDERHAYGCKSDDAGFLEGPAQNDQRRN
jgi:hypothetical protein